MPEPLPFTAIDPATITLTYEWGAALLAVSYDDKVAVLMRDEEGDLIVCGDTRRGNGQGISGDADHAHLGDYTYHAGELPKGVARVRVRAGTDWVDGQISADRSVWLAVTRGDDEIVRLEDAAGAIVPRPLPAEDAEREPIADAWSQCPACEACEWELIGWEEPGFEDEEDEEDDDLSGPFQESAARCRRCGHRVHGVDADEPEETEELEEFEEDVPAVIARARARDLAASGRPIYELAGWEGARSWAGAFGGEHPDGPQAFVSLAFGEEGDAPWATVVTFCEADLDPHVESGMMTAIDGDLPEPPAPPPGASSAARSLADRLFWSAWQEPEHEPVHAEIDIEGTPTIIEGLAGTVAWMGEGTVAPGVRVSVTAAGIDPAAVRLRRITDVEPYLS
ncbi:MAG: hypothetical protein JHC95_12885 [Solirubrobacteraceae bacterium]|nr:hypothetical protein [Solirubrobacteraceae bacterium]